MTDDGNMTLIDKLNDMKEQIKITLDPPYEPRRREFLFDKLPKQAVGNVGISIAASSILKSRLVGFIGSLGGVSRLQSAGLSVGDPDQKLQGMIEDYNAELLSPYGFAYFRDKLSRAQEIIKYARTNSITDSLDENKQLFEPLFDELVDKIKNITTSRQHKDYWENRSSIILENVEFLLATYQLDKHVQDAYEPVYQTYRTIVRHASTSRSQKNWMSRAKRAADNAVKLNKEIPLDNDVVKDIYSPLVDGLVAEAESWSKKDDEMLWYEHFEVAVDEVRKIDERSDGIFTARIEPTYKMAYDRIMKDAQVAMQKDDIISLERNKDFFSRLNLWHDYAKDVLDYLIRKR